jgi:DNA polymerase I-like protein with 3'-5' exonuclease and polymerase domains
MELSDLQLSALNPPMNITHVVDEAGLAKVADFLSRVDEIGFDLETNIEPTVFERKVRTIQVGNRAEQYVIDLLPFAGSPERLREQGGYKTPEWAQPVVDTVRPALENNRHLKLGVNLPFDYMQCVWSLGLLPWNFYDCYQVEKLIHAGRVGYFQKDFWAMDDMFARYTNKRISKAEQSTFDLDNPLTTSQLEYAAFDTRAPFVIRVGQAKEVAALGKCVYIENQAIPAFGDLHVNGILLDTTKWLAVVEKVEREHEEHVKVLDTYFAPVCGTKYYPPYSDDDLARIESTWRDEKDRLVRAEYRKEYQAASKARKEWETAYTACEGEAYINYDSPAQILVALRKLGFGVKELPNTNDKVLHTLSHHPVIEALQDYRGTKKALKSYGKKFIEAHVDPITGRVHSRIDQIGAETGRTSSSKPNMQNIPKDFGYRACFVARPGYKFVSVDMAGAELRILAELSGDPIMVEAFAKGWDVHSVGAEIIFGQRWKDAAEATCAYYHTADHQKCKCKKHKELRDQIKAINFGIIYGKEAKALSEELGITMDEAKVLLKMWRDAFKVATIYLTNLANQVKMNLVVRTFSGRRRYFERPDWAHCRQLAMDRLKEKGKDPLSVQSRDVSRIYGAMHGSIEREGKNTPMQGGNADVAKLAMGCGFDKNGEGFLWHKLREYDAIIIEMVHDELGFEVREDQVENFIPMVGSCIKRAAKELMSRVEMDYEASVGDYWSK